MSLFSGPTEHAANPPETWQVRKAGDRRWDLTTADGTVLSSYPTKARAEEDRDQGGFFTRIYAEEARWYAGETKPGQKSWAQCRAEREKVQRRVAERGRAGVEARIERTLGSLRSNYRAMSNDPMPSDVVEWARWHIATYPGSASDYMAGLVAQIDADRAELARVDAVLADLVAA